MLYYSAILAIVLCHAFHHTEATSLDDDVLDEILANYCPKVDICDRNATSADLRPNEKLGFLDRVSCCKGCSCHPDCKSKLNCCYPDEDDADPVCTHMRIGAPGTPKWDANVPAYYTIWTPPVGGCINVQPFQAVTGETLQPTCGPQSAAYWGTLYPVLSSVSKDIYKNEACARCHGITDYELFLPYLECEMPITEMNDRVTLTDYIRMYDNSPLPTFCYIFFEYRDVSVVRTKSCALDVIAACKPNVIVQSAIVKDLSLGMIDTACRNGFYAPVIAEKFWYRNIFCVLCNENYITVRNLKCNLSGAKDEIGQHSAITVLLDPKYLKSTNAPNARSSRVVHRKACIKDKAAWREATCRNIHCPTGMVYNVKGVCVHISSTWRVAGFSINVKLSPIGGNISLFEENLIPLLDEITESSPWPAPWSVYKGYSKLQEGLRKADGLFIISLQYDKNMYSIARFIGSVRQALSTTWVTEVNGNKLQFKQSILEYGLVGLTKTARPFWSHFIKTNSTVTKLDDAAVWKKKSFASRIYRFPNVFYRRHICEQVDLREDEFESEVDQYLIKNKLDGRWLFDQEFVMVDDEMGNRVARICLSDTPLVERISGVESTSGWYVNWFIIPFTLTAILA